MYQVGTITCITLSIELDDVSLIMKADLENLFMYIYSCW